METKDDLRARLEELGVEAPKSATKEELLDLVAENAPAVSTKDPETGEWVDADPGDDDAHVVETVVAWNGITATDTVDGVAQAVRPATLAEQLTMHADELLRLVVGSVPYATSGTIDLDGQTITITLTSH